MDNKIFCAYCHREVAPFEGVHLREDICETCNQLLYEDYNNDHDTSYDNPEEPNDDSDMDVVTDEDDGFSDDM